MDKMRKSRSKKLMRWKLVISVWEDNYGDFLSSVKYKDRPYILPEDIKNLYNSLGVQLNGKWDVAEVVYDTIKHTVNDMLMEIQTPGDMEIWELKMRMVTQFDFPPAIRPITISDTTVTWMRWELPRAYGSYPWANSNDQSYYEWVRGANSIYYVTEKDYLIMRDNGELDSNTLYCIVSQ